MSKSKSYRKYAATTMAVAVASSAVAPVVAGAEEIQFSDVSEDSPHYDSIIAMAEKGIIQGMTETEFAPYENVYRLQVAKMLQRALNLGVPSNADQLVRSYTDITENYTQEDRDAIAAVTAVGIFEGDANDKFNAWEPINREQMASVLVRAFGLDQIDAGSNVNINLSNVDRNHKNNVQILANLGLTDAFDDYKPADYTNREQFASFLDRVFDKVEDAGFKVADVIGLDDYNRYLEVSFNQQVTSLEPSNIKIVDAKSEERYGVKSVNLASDGLSAQVELFAHEGSDKFVLQNNRDYTVTVNANGQVSEFTFNRPAFLDERVVDIDVADREITVSTASGLRTFKVPSDMDEFNFQKALGETLYVWYDQDNYLVDYRVTDESAKYDAIEFTKRDEIELISEGEKYKFSREDFTGTTDNKKVSIFYNGEEVTELVDGKLPESGSNFLKNKYNFAKVGFDKSGNVEYVGVYDLDDFLIVDKVDGDEVVGIAGEGTGGAFDAEDATIIKDGEIISLSDLENGDVLFFNEDANDDDGFAEVLNQSVTGEIDRVYSDAVRIDGKDYKFTNRSDLEDYNVEYAGYTSAVYINDDDETEYIDSDAAEELQAAGEVTVYTDRAGNVVYIAGDREDVQSSKVTSILTADINAYSQGTRDRLEIETKSENNKEELFDTNLKSLKSIILDGETYDIDNDANNNKWTATLTGNDTVIELEHNLGEKDTVQVKLDEYGLKGNLVKVHLNKDTDQIEKLELYDERSTSLTTNDSPLEYDDSYVKGKKLNSNTVVFDAKSFVSNPKDITVTTWGEYKGSDISEAEVIFDKDNEVIAIAINDTTTDADVYEEAVITKVLKNTDGEVVEVTAYIDGEKRTIEVDEVNVSDDFKRGVVAVFAFDDNNDDLVKDIIEVSEFNVGEDNQKNFGPHYAFHVTSEIKHDDVNIGKREVEIPGSQEGTYKLASKGLVIDATDKSDITTESLSDLRGKDDVTVILDEKDSNFVKFFVIGAEDMDLDGPTEPTDPEDPDPTDPEDPEADVVEFTTTDSVAPNSIALSLEIFTHYDIAGTVADDYDEDTIEIVVTDANGDTDTIEVDVKDDGTFEHTINAGDYDENLVSVQYADEDPVDFNPKVE